MIIFYNKKTCKVLGVIEGRVHKNPKRFFMESTSILTEDIGKYVVPFKVKYRIEEQPRKEMRVVDKKTMRVEEVIVGKKKVKVGEGMEPDVPFAKLISDFESGKKNIYDYKIKLRNKKVVGFNKK